MTEDDRKKDVAIAVLDLEPTTVTTFTAVFFTSRGQSKRRFRTFHILPAWHDRSQ
jgi:hypothetical protein